MPEMRSRPCPVCCLCGTPGELLHGGLSDQLFGAPGLWTLKKCSNSQCRLAWLDPMPLEEDIGKAYANYHTHEDFSAPRDSWLRRVYTFVKAGYLARQYGYERNLGSKWQAALGSLLYLVPSRRAAVDAQVFYLPAKKQGRLLDVGCGNGQTLSSMAGLGWQAEGIDTDAAAIQVANAKGLTARQGTLQSQQLTGGAFDAVIMNHVIEHVHDPLALMKECHRILKPGGRLVVITPNILSWGHRIYQHNWRGLEPPRHLQIFARSSLAALSIRAGFSSSECRTATRGAGSILLASESLKRKEAAGPGPGRLSRLWAEVMGLAEWARAYLDHDAGEELILVSIK
jgi:2-polyprenyl-3-methyl-5-hydroxy-6-metoxy-1,4-benzoquinol methylase